MIVVRIQGGIGNQMFQYAFGRSLSLLNNTECSFDISAYKTYKKHKYLLDSFHIQKNTLSPEKIRVFTRRQKLRGRLADLLPFVSGWQHKYIRESSGFDAFLLENKYDDAYFDGYWQSERYFSGCAAKIRQDFTLKRPFGTEANACKEQIRTTPHSVALHIRRGDYVHEQHTNAFHGVMPLSYYETATRLLTEKISSPHFFIFSDDISWAKDHLRLGYPMSFISGEGMADEEELTLMSQCQHFIIANSTFSWWGAWLSEYPDKQVFAPLKWFQNPQKETGMLIPPQWTRI